MWTVVGPVRRGRHDLRPMTLVPGDPLAHRALDSLLRAEASVRRRLSADLEREGLSASGFSVLVVLTTAGGHLELRTLRRRLQTSKANATEVVTTLEQRGMVVRSRLAHDRRAATVALTGARPGGRRSPLPRAHRARPARLRGPRRGREALAGGDLPQARGLSGSYNPPSTWRAVPSIRSSRSLPSSRRSSRAGASATCSANRSAAARARSPGCSGRARRPPTAAPAPTTSSRACSRTSTRATRRCAATTSSARVAGTVTGSRSRSPSSSSWASRTSTRSRPTGSPSSTSAAASRSSSSWRTGTR